jgi:hypothetical protein
MKNNRTISAPKRGMNTDNSHSILDQTSYSLAVNADTSNEQGDFLNVQYEPSNYYSVLFPDTYKVIGFKKDLLKERTYYFLTSTETNTASIHYKRSSIGYVNDIVGETFNQDQESTTCDECNSKNVLDTPLEDITQTPAQTFVELEHDRCISLADIEEKGLNFNINFPIKKIEIKQEKLGTKLYWDDFRNEPRYLNVTNLEESLENNVPNYLHIEEVSCADDIVHDCILVDKLLIFPKHNRIILDAAEQQTGGNLKKGTYEFYAAYCDLYGNEATQYCTPTNPISIFDENDNILAQTETDSFTNFAIKINVKNLDTEHFKYYKVAVVERNNVANTQSVFVAGIYPTTDDTVVYTHSGSSNDDLYISRGNVSIKKRMDFYELKAVKPRFSRAKGTMTSGDSLWHYGCEEAEEINLQPVVNLFSSLLHWQTSAAKEDLYKSAIATSKYKGYMRNEVQPFAIRFHFKDGGYTGNFPLIARPKETEDATIVTDTNFDSIDANSTACITNERNEKWQIFNTASKYAGDCFDINSDENSSTSVEDVYKTCTVEDVFTVPANSINIPTDEEFYDLESYIQDGNTVTGISEYLDDDYPGDCEPLFEGDCTSLTLESEEVEIGEILGETKTSVEKVLTDYPLSIPPTQCNQFSRNASGNYIVNNDMQPFMDCNDVVYKRDSNFSNESCSYASDLPQQTDPTQNFASTFFNVYGANSEVELLKNSYGVQPSTVVDGFKNKLHKNAQFYKVTKNSRNKILLEITKQSSCLGLEDLNYTTQVRYTVYNSCSSPTVLAGGVVNTSTGQLIELDTTAYPNTFYVAFDTPIEVTTVKSCPPVDCTYPILRVGKAVCSGASLYSASISYNAGAVITSTAGTIVGNTIIDVPIGNSVTVTATFNGCIFSETISPPASCVNVCDTTASFSILENTDTEYSISIHNPSGATITASVGTVTATKITNIPAGVSVDITITKIGCSPVVETILPLTKWLPNTYRNVPLCGCISFYQRDVEYSSINVSWTGVKLNKIQNWKSTCTFKIPKINSCDPVPYQKGKFAYWESTETYADNLQLFDSSNIKIKTEDLSLLSAADKQEFLDYYKESFDAQGNIVWKESIKEATGQVAPVVDFTCRPIRHYKFPDNTVAPFITDSTSLQKNADSIVFPLGVVLDSNVVKTMIEVAYNNDLLTKKQKNSIVSYEILKGDNSIHKSVIANGLGFDMYNYTKGSDVIHYANFPFNDLGRNKFSTTTLNGDLIDHPYGSNKNHMFSFLSPDVFLTKPSIPTEVTLQGYIFGNSETSFADVDKHPGWTVLGDKSRRTAERLAIAEAYLEYAIQTADILKYNYTTVGTSNTVTWGPIAAIAVYAVAAVASSFMKIGKYRYDWLKIFRDLGPVDNFASFQVSSAKYNRFLKTEQFSSEYLRALSLRKYIRDGEYEMVEEGDAKRVKINNYLREHSVVLSTGENYKFNYPTEYVNYDNNKVNNWVSSTVTASEVGCANHNRNTRNVASPYFSLKNYIPDQWGTLDNIKWLTTNYIFDLNEDTDCKPIYGGTVCISRFSWRRKVPMFRKHAIGLPDKLPFNYSKYDNIGYPKYYCDYEVGGTYQGTGLPFPDIDSYTAFDCESGRTYFYYAPPSKFYLFVHGVVDFLVESEINCNFRYAKTQPKDWFYPQQQNLETWLQESHLTISEPNSFYYNNSYTLPVSDTPFKVLDRTYDKEVWEKRRKSENLIIRSQKDTNENALVDPWLIYKPVDAFEFGTEKGELIDLRDIESEQFLARFTDSLELHNAIDNLAERITPQNKETGLGFLSQRVMDYKSTDLGFTGTQHTDFCSTPYGHFWVDAKRGRVFQIDQSGRSLNIISENIQGQPSGMKNWFREHLPMKILKQLPKLDIDNKFKGIGFNIWYDDRKSRVFITKRDYVLQKGIDPDKFTYDEETGELFYNANIIVNRAQANASETFFDNDTLFKDVSWTISYKPTEGVWSSFYTFYPDYSPSHQNYFQVGYNWGKSKGTMWNHLMNNKSFLVFQGDFNPMSIEFPIVNQNANKILNSVTVNAEARRYQNQWDFAVDRNIGFTNMFIYNSTNNSGMLNLFAQKSLTDSRKYPKTNPNNTQDILFTPDEDKHNINYFFNRMVNQDNNIPMFTRDENNIFKTIDSRAVKFSGKKVLERLKGEHFMVNLSNTKESRFNLIFKNLIDDETLYGD